MDTTQTAKHFETVEMVCALVVRNRFRMDNARQARQHYAFADCVSRAWGIWIERACAQWDGKGEILAWAKVIARREAGKECDRACYQKRSAMASMLDAGSDRPSASAGSIEASLAAPGLVKHSAKPEHRDHESADNARPSVRAISRQAPADSGPDMASGIDGKRQRAALADALGCLTDAERMFWGAVQGATDQNEIATRLGWSAAKVSRYMASVAAKLGEAVRALA